MKINHPRPDGHYQFRWRTTGAHGRLDRDDALTAATAVTYESAGSRGTDDVTVEAFQIGPEGAVRIGASVATVQIEDEPTLFPAAYRAVTTDTAAVGVVTFEAPPAPGPSPSSAPAARSDFFGDTIRLSGPTQHIVGDVDLELPAGTWGWGLSSGGGPPGWGANVAAWLDGRFQGFTFYVEGTRQ
ncbi:MAG: hypothetical protein R3F43_32660 [bacterium]